ncbi:nuclear transport factor 2 family protein [Companilactobacillus mishanensis]|uniref:Nuclear transport factor 2 family protein n=1 Tax=Companilactobacillus mishanensis TaxID=2486008 RepID=A0ABW9P856_9LACO|nr:nuclear transport factor 2 family protein [Companilactobacillus mishanensis]MQS45401.1 nuclear transport factor 2 family protein [Companilactobacillus mishanensis]
MNLQEMSDKMEIQEIMNRLSTCADDGDVEGQTMDFTDDAVFRVVHETTVNAEVNGKDNIYQMFNDPGLDFKFVYHLNGQCVINLHGDTADGVTYNQVTWQAKIDGKQTTMTECAKYNCKYIRTEQGWKIQELESNFVFSLPIK